MNIISKYLKFYQTNLIKQIESKSKSQTLILRLRNFYSKRNLDTEFEVSLVGTMDKDISWYTQSELPMVAGKHLTRHAKNGYAAVAILATLLRGPQVFGRDGNRCRGRLRHQMYLFICCDVFIYILYSWYAVIVHVNFLICFKYIYASLMMMNWNIDRKFG